MNLVADTSAWIEFVRGTGSLTNQHMVAAIGGHRVLLPDLVYHEVLRGVPGEIEASSMIRQLRPFVDFQLCNMSIAEIAAKNYRLLRTKGITVRGTIDTLIATWCIENNVPLLHADRDYAGFEEYLGLKRWPRG